jgi:S1-C subfamily serine protease
MTGQKERSKNMKLPLLGQVFAVFLLTVVSVAQSQTKNTIAELQQSVVKIVMLDPQGQPNSVGTGFFVDKGTLIATASHVFLEAGKMMVDHGGGKLLAWKNFSDGHKLVFPIELAAADYGHDTAIMKFDVAAANQQAKQEPNFEIKPLTLDDHNPELGDTVGFLGFFASDDFPLWSRTVVSGFTPVPKQIVLDVPANPGQSGSPVVSLESGKVVGVLTSFVPVILVPGSLPTHSGLSRSVEVEHLKRLIESAVVR